MDSAVKESDHWYVDYVSRLTPEDLNESVDFTFTDGVLGRMSREEMLSHVVLHGGYHRGAIGRIMAQLSITPGRARDAIVASLVEDPLLYFRGFQQPGA